MPSIHVCRFCRIKIMLVGRVRLLECVVMGDRDVYGTVAYLDRLARLAGGGADRCHRVRDAVYDVGGLATRSTRCTVITPPATT